VLARVKCSRRLTRVEKFSGKLERRDRRLSLFLSLLCRCRDVSPKQRDWRSDGGAIDPSRFFIYDRDDAIISGALNFVTARLSLSLSLSCSFSLNGWTVHAMIAFLFVAGTFGESLPAIRQRRLAIVLFSPRSRMYLCTCTARRY